jgi:hypothetical protein
MRTTTTLDDDVFAKLRAICGRTGESFRVVLNRLLRAALAARTDRRPKEPFRVRARRLGSRPGVALDNVAELLEGLDGPTHA